MPQVRDPKTGRYTSGGSSSVGGAASTNPRVQKAKAVGGGATAGGASSEAKVMAAVPDKVIEYGVSRRHDRVFKKGDNYVTDNWSAAEYAKANGWENIGSIPDEARKRGMIK